MSWRVSTVAVVLVIGVTVPPFQAQAPPAKGDPVLADFNNRIKAYIAVRDKADNGAPPLTQTTDAAKIKAAQDALAVRIRAARPNAKRGDIFAPGIQDLFLALLRPPLKGPDGKETKETIQHDNPGTLVLPINGSYPDEAPLSTVPPNVLALLPKLPDGLDYRFVYKHLILRDTRAHLMVDFIFNAIR